MNAEHNSETSPLITLEERLNELGVYTFEQVAKMKKKNVAWLDERLRFKGRIERDDWIGQAKKLAKEQG